jgi:hypothetical protein
MELVVVAELAYFMLVVVYLSTVVVSCHCCPCALLICALSILVVVCPVAFGAAETVVHFGLYLCSLP